MNRGKKKAFRPELGDALEGRALMTASAFLDYGTGELAIAGDYRNDNVRIQLEWDDSVSVYSGSALIFNEPDSSLVAFITYVDAGGNDRLVNATGYSLFANMGNGNDWVVGGWGDDQIDGGNGNDAVYGGEGNDGLYGSAGNDHVDGGNGNDAIYGSAGNDWLYGGNGDDFVAGGAGNDEVGGGFGRDILQGGAGVDTFGDPDNLYFFPPGTGQLGGVLDPQKKEYYYIGGKRVRF